MDFISVRTVEIISYFTRTGILFITLIKNKHFFKKYFELLHAFLSIEPFFDGLLYINNRYQCIKKLMQKKLENSQSKLFCLVLNNIFENLGIHVCHTIILYMYFRSLFVPWRMVLDLLDRLIAFTHH